MVNVQSSATGTAYSGASSTTGSYTISQLPPGEYELTVTAPGFKTYNRKNLQIETGQTLRQDAALQIGGTGETVTVTGDASMLRTESGDLAVNITVGTLDNLPLLGIGTTNSGSSGVRNPYNMLQMLPGVGNYTANSRNDHQRPRGLRQHHRKSVPHRRPGLDEPPPDLVCGAKRNQPSADAIQEVAIQTSNYAPEFGTAGAAVLNITMKSGTNQFHGSVYDYFVNEDLNAGYPYSISTGSGGKLRPRNRRNDFGGTIGGPVWIPKLYNGHNKTFFFFNLERYVESNFYTFTDTVPTAAMIAGDFSAISPNGTCSLCATYGIPTSPLGTPTQAVDPLGRPLYANTIYDPNTRGVTASGLGYANPVAEQYDSNEPYRSGGDQKLAVAFSQASKLQPHRQLRRHRILGHRNSQIPAFKIDESATAKRNKFSFYYSETSTESQISSPFGNADGLPTEIGAYRGTFVYAWTYRLNYDRTISPTLLLHLGAGFEQTQFR